MPRSGKPWQKRADAPQRLTGRKWRELREAVLRRDNYLCQCPECLGGKLRLRMADEVDHIKPYAWFANGRATGDPDDPENLRAVNSDCHKRITIRQRGHKPRPQIGLDGWPIE